MRLCDPEVDPQIGKLRDSVHDLNQRPPEAIHVPDCDDVELAILRCLHELVELGAVELCPGDDLREFIDYFMSSTFRPFMQLECLRFGVLFRSADASVDRHTFRFGCHRSDAPCLAGSCISRSLTASLLKAYTSSIDENEGNDNGRIVTFWSKENRHLSMLIQHVFDNGSSRIAVFGACHVSVNHSPVSAFVSAVLTGVI